MEWGGTLCTAGEGTRYEVLSAIWIILGTFGARREREGGGTWRVGSFVRATVEPIDAVQRPTLLSSWQHDAAGIAAQKALHKTAARAELPAATDIELSGVLSGLHCHLGAICPHL